MFTNEFNVHAEKLKQDLQRIEHDFANASAETKDQVQAYAAQTMERLQEQGRKTMAAAKEMGAQADQKVRDNPWQAIAIAAAISFILGFLTSRHKD